MSSIGGPGRDLLGQIEENTDDLESSLSTGPVPVREINGTTSTVTSVAGSASSVTLLASNTSRISATINNDAATILYIKFGSTASTTSYTYKLLADDLAIIDDFTGLISGIWSAATGNARITEIT